MLRELDSKVTVDSLTTLAREITCLLCKGQLRDARHLPCYHFFCRECLQYLIKGGGKLIETIVCPTCGEDSQCVEPDELPRVMFVEQLKDIHRLLSERTSSCGLCSAPESSSYCKQCAEFLCVDCVFAHNKMKIKFSSHKVFPLSEVTCSEGYDQLGPQTGFKVCLEHSEQCKLFCVDCKKEICCDCIIIEHSQHQFDFIKKIASDVRETIHQTCRHLKGAHSDIQEARKKIDHTKHEIKCQGVFVKSHIQEKFSDIMEELKREEKELLSQTEQSVQKKLIQLDQQQESITKTGTKLSHLLHFTKRSLEAVSDKQLISSQQLLQKQLDSEMLKLVDIQLKPTQTANIAVKIVAAPEIASFVREKAMIYHFPLSTGSPVHVTEVGKQTTHFVTDLGDSSPTAPSSLTALLKSAAGGSTVRGQVTKTGKGLYEVTYTPMVRGRHGLQIVVNGEPVSGQPKPVFVFVSPENLGPVPVRVLTGFKHPFAAAFDSQQHLLITESSGMKVTRVQREGKVLSQSGHFDEIFIPNPTGLAIDRSTGNLYIASGRENSICKYSSRGKLLGEFRAESRRLDHPCGLTLVNDQLFVCDRNNSQVQIFDRDLNHLQSFGKHGSSLGDLHWPYSLIQNSNGHLVIADCDNHRLQEFTHQGIFLRSFVSNGSQQGQLYRPVGLCLGNGGHLFVTDFETHRLSVFDRDGVHVCSLGKYGTGEGEMCYPAGVAIDADGYVYVCDQGNNRILVY